MRIRQSSPTSAIEWNSSNIDSDAHVGGDINIDADDDKAILEVPLSSSPPIQFSSSPSSLFSSPLLKKSSGWISRDGSVEPVDDAKSVRATIIKQGLSTSRLHQKLSELTRVQKLVVVPDIDPQAGLLRERSQSLPICSLSRQKGKNTVITSYIQGIKRQRDSEGHNQGPASKQQRLDICLSSGFSRHRPASLRRADSLKASSELASSEVNDAPTVPCSPAAESPDVGSLKAKKGSCSRRDLVYPPVPIIAPPADYVAPLPLSRDASAKVRIQHLIDRERKTRRDDGLGNTDRMTRSCWEQLLGIGRDSRRSVINWLLEVLPAYLSMNGIRNGSANSVSSTSTSPRTASSFSPCSFTRSTPSSSGSCEDPETRQRISDLLDQLTTSPETRFLAAHMFLRYCYIIVGCPPGDASQVSSDGSDDDDHLFEDGKHLMVWDIAIGCLALSIKYLRDTLSPLDPVVAREFQALSPKNITLADLESSQRSIFAALSYKPGATPQFYLDEFWEALPSLRELFSGRMLTWNSAKRHTWCALYAVITEPGVLHHPIYMLAAAAMVYGATIALAAEFATEAPWYEGIPRNGPGDSNKAFTESQEKYAAKAELVMEGVVQDVEAILNVSHVDFRRCRGWMELSVAR